MAAQIQGMDLDYKPWGGLAGIMAGDREAETEAANLLALQESQLGNIIKQRDAAFAQDEMSNPELRTGRIQGMIGDSQVKTAAGLTAKGTQKSDMEAKIAENIAKVPKAQVEKALAETHLQTQGLMALAQSLGEGDTSNLDFTLKAQEMAPKLGMSPQDLQQLLQNPQLLAAKIAQNQQRLTMVPAVLQKMAEQEQNAKMQGKYITEPTNLSHEKVASGNNATSIRVAEINAESRKAATEAKKQSAVSIINSAMSGKLDYAKAATALTVMAMTEEDPEVKKQLEEYARKFEAAELERKKAAGSNKVDLNAAGGVPTTQVAPQLGGSAPTGQTKSGVKFKVIP